MQYWQSNICRGNCKKIISLLMACQCEYSTMVGHMTYRTIQKRVYSKQLKIPSRKKCNFHFLRDLRNKKSLMPNTFISFPNYCRNHILGHLKLPPDHKLSTGTLKRENWGKDLDFRYNFYCACTHSYTNTQS